MGGPTAAELLRSEKQTSPEQQRSERPTSTELLRSERPTSTEKASEPRHLVAARCSDAAAAAFFFWRRVSPEMQRLTRSMEDIGEDMVVEIHHAMTAAVYRQCPNLSL